MKTAVEVAYEVDRIEEVAALRVVAPRPGLVLVMVVQEVDPGIDIVEVLVNEIMVSLIVMVVVPAARASRPLRKNRAARVAAQVIVDFFVVVCVDVVESVAVRALAVLVLTTRAPDREMVLLLVTPFCVLVT